MRITILAVLLTLFSTQIITAQSFTADQKQSIKGLNALLLVVEFTEPGVEADGLKKEDLENAIATRLRSSGIRLMSPAEWAGTSGVPYLHVVVNTLKSELGFYSFKIDVQLNQEIVLKRNTGISMMSTTWSRGTLGHIGTNRINTIRNDVLGFINQFVNDYKSVNPG
jgi:hypothetical protein